MRCGHRREPNLTAAYVRKGTLLLEQGDRAQARTMFSKALAIDPGEPEALGMQEVSLLEEGRYEEAIAYFDRIVALDPDNPRAYLSRGDAHLLITTRLEGLMEEEYLNRTGRFDPSSLSGEAADHYQQAVSDYNRAMMLDPTLTPVVTLRVLGKTQASVTHFQSMLDAM
ncbi:MAG: tetratricopeptide repeat protein [Methanomicrobiales archaeon]